jgi:peptide chain release factor 2
MGCFIHIVAGAGGAEAADCANILFGMYKNWCDLRAYSLAVVNAVPGEIAGIKSAVMEIQTLEAYPLVRGEQGRPPVCQDLAI